MSVFAFFTERPPGPVPPTPIFDRFCIVFLTIDWIAFGCMHFTAHDETVRMLPDWIPFANTTVVLTGIAEVTIGIALFYRRARRIAAVGSLLLLVLYIPAVVHILQDNAALPFCKPDGGGCDPAAWPNRLWRILGVPHNVLMAICSLHVLERPYPEPWRSASPVPLQAPAPTGTGYAAALVAAVLLLCNAAGFLALLLGARDRSTSSMWMMMCLAVGALVGFLFAVPRLNTKARNSATLLPNRNIEAVSDWLTKILVGLGLVNLRQIGAFLVDRSNALAPVFGTNADFTMAFLVYFTVTGFLEGYLLTRIFLQWHFVDSLQAAAKGDGSSGPVPES